MDDKAAGVRGLRRGGRVGGGPALSLYVLYAHPAVPGCREHGQGPRLLTIHTRGRSHCTDKGMTDWLTSCGRFENLLMVHVPNTFT